MPLKPPLTQDQLARLDTLRGLAGRLERAVNAVADSPALCDVPTPGRNVSRLTLLDQALGDLRAHVVLMEAKGDVAPRLFFDPREPMARSRALALGLPEEPPSSSRTGAGDTSGTPTGERRT